MFLFTYGGSDIIHQRGAMTKTVVGAKQKVTGPVQILVGPEQKIFGPIQNLIGARAES